MTIRLAPACHRRTSLEDALTHVRATLELLQLDVETETFGGDPYPTYRCTLRNRAGELVSVSAGKGRGQQALASALFEGVEHFLLAWTSQAVSGVNLPIEWFSAENLARQPALTGDLLIQRMARDRGESRFPSVRYDSFPARDHVWYPIFFSDPSYHNHPVEGDDIDALLPLLKYATSSGTASGNSVPEALVHALTELIERDARSMELLSWYIAGDGEVRIVDRGSLTDPLKRLLLLTEDEVQEDVLLVDMTSSIDVPSYLATPRRHASPIKPVGCGTSPDPHYALERSLTELLQMHRIDEGSQAFREGDLEALARLSNYPALRDAAEFDIELLLSRTGTMDVPLRSQDASLLALSPEQCVDFILERLAEADCPVYWRQLGPQRAPVKIVTALAPGVERFNAVSGGLPVIPTGRGFSLWKRPAEAVTAG